MHMIIWTVYYTISVHKKKVRHGTTFDEQLDGKFEKKKNLRKCVAICYFITLNK